jgi:riboflavin biosynthesis pyrimidine reductase
MIAGPDGAPLALGEAARRWIEAQCQRADARLRHEGDLLELSINARMASRWHVRDRNGRPDLPAAISDLVARDVSSVVALPDAPLAESLIGAGLGDRLFLIETGEEVGRGGVPATALGTIEGRLRAARLTEVQVTPLGGDSLRTYEPER